MNGTQDQGLKAQDFRRRMYTQVHPAPVSNSGTQMEGFVAAKKPTHFDVIKPAAQKRELTPRIVATPDAEPIIQTVKRGVSIDAPKVQSSQVLSRQAFRSAATILIEQSQHAEQTTAPLRRRAFIKLPKNRTQGAMIAMAVMVFGIGMAVSYSTFQTNHSAKAQVAAIAAGANNELTDGASDGTTPPSEEKPATKVVSSYAVAPNLPRYIDIAKLNVHARVRPMGVNRLGEIQAPANIYDAGWYNASARPGDLGSNGAMLVDGHVLGATYPAIFSKIKSLSGGDIIKITRGDGQVYKYQVVKVQNYDADKLDIAMLLTSIQPGKAGLNLITCGGKYLAKQQTFDQRTVVFTVQI